MTSLVTRYRVLPTLAGREFLPIAFLARLPGSMTQIGTVILVSTETGSLASAGLVAGALGVGAAIGGPVIGALADRTGQRTVMLVASALNALSTLALVFLVLGGASLPLTLATAFLAGATIPQIGPLVRSRWVTMTGGGENLGTAMSYEGAADESAYVLGPAVVSILAAIASPAAAVVVAAVLVGIFGIWVSVHPTVSAAPRRLAGSTSTAVWKSPAVLAISAIGLTIGTFFGGMQTGTASLAAAAGAPGSAGLIYALLGLGSAIAGLATSALPARFSLPDRLVASVGGMALLVSPLLLIDSVAALLVGLFFLGAAVGPAMITLYSLSERAVPADRSSSAMTLLASGVVIGYSIGSTLGGRLAENYGSSAAFAVSLVAMVLGTGLALVLRARRRG